MKPYLIGIAGPSSAGKSTLSGVVEQEYRDRLEHIKADDFYKNKEDVPLIDSWTNWETPEALKLDELYCVLTNLQAGKNALIPVYNKQESRQVGERLVVPKPILLVEGFLLFADPKIANLFDLKIFVEVEDPNVQLERRKIRHQGLDVEYFWQVMVPMFERYGLAAREEADFVLDGSRPREEMKDDFVRILQAHAPILESEPIVI